MMHLLVISPARTTKELLKNGQVAEVTDAKGRTSIDWYAPSPDGRYVAVCLSEGGSERGAASVYEVDPAGSVATTAHLLPAQRIT